MEWDSKPFEDWLLQNLRDSHTARFTTHIIEHCVSKVGIEEFTRMALTKDCRDVIDFFYPTKMRLPRVSPYRTAVYKYLEFIRKNNNVCDTTNTTEK